MKIVLNRTHSVQFLRFIRCFQQRFLLDTQQYFVNTVVQFSFLKFDNDIEYYAKVFTVVHMIFTRYWSEKKTKRFSFCFGFGLPVESCKRKFDMDVSFLIVLKVWESSMKNRSNTSMERESMEREWTLRIRFLWYSYTAWICIQSNWKWSIAREYPGDTCHKPNFKDNDENLPRTHRMRS